MKNQKELVIKIVWRVTLSVLALIAIVNTLYFGITDTMVLANQLFMMAFVAIPCLVGVGILWWGLLQAISIFLRDMQNYLDCKSFEAHFWKPLLCSFVAFGGGFLMLFLSYALFCMTQKATTETAHVFAGWIDSAYDTVLQMFAWAYALSVVFAGGAFLQRKVIKF